MIRLARALLVLLAVAIPALARAQTDVIRGRVTSADGSPLTGVRVTATSIPGNVTREVRTNAKGQYQLAFPGGQGDYMMGFAQVGYQYRQFEIKRTADQDVLVADARLAVVQLDTVAVVEKIQQRVSRDSKTPDVSGTEQQIAADAIPAEAVGDLAAMAASLPGVLLVPGLDGQQDGFSVLGLGADQNTTTLNGQPLNGSSLPRDAAISTSLSTSPYDVSRGGFAGGNLNIRTGSGSNYRQRGMSLQLNAPQLQWTDRASSALGNEFTSYSLGGLASGPIKLNKSFYNVSYQLDRNSRDNATLLSAGPLGLTTAGVAVDSVTRFLDILGRRGVPVGGRGASNRLSDNGRLLGSFDFSPPNSISGASYKVAVNGNWGRQNPVGGSVTQLANASGERTNWGAGAQVAMNRYYGLILSETDASVNTSRTYGEPYLDLPAGRVLVSSILANDASSVQSLVFGGSQGLNSSSRSLGATFKNTLSWFDDANKHRLKLATELGFNGSRAEQSSNLLGTFSFNSLADLEAGRPASYSRQLTTRRTSTGTFNGALSLGDSYRRSPDLQIQYGIRVEASRFDGRPTFNPAVERAFGRRNDRIPTPLAISPRIGFSRTLGTAQEIGAFQGAVRGPRAVLRGGLGLFANGVSAGSVASAVENTGLPSGVQQLLCVGDATPTPNWSAYANGTAVPDHCADGTGATVFSSTAPNVVLVSTGYKPSQRASADLSWDGSVLDNRFHLRASTTLSLNLHQQRQVDLNFDPTTRFALEAEGGRPVFVPSTSIVSTTGAIPIGASRKATEFSRVNEIRSDLQSQSAQVQLGINPVTRTPTALGWSLTYTFNGVREQVAGFQNTAGNPLDVVWARSAQGPHQLSYSLRYNFFNYVTVNWNGQFRSGAHYTPMVAGDVNGDGYSNDRAFVFDPATADASVAAGMRDLLGHTSGAARDCLEKQLGRIAGRNSCVASWSSTASLNFSLDRARFRLPNRSSMSFSLSNPLGAADLALHGSEHLRGWGQTAFPDASLLYVRGFNATTKRYTYEVNQRFGATRPQFLTLRSPVSLTVSMRVDLGPTREAQNLEQNLANGRKTPGSKFPESAFRSIGSSSVQNPMSTILRQQDSLQLTATQADSIASMNRRYAYRVDSLWTPVARYLFNLPEHYRGEAAYARYLEARHAQVELMLDATKLLRDLLTPAQRRKLPAWINNYFDPRYLKSIRNGNGLYVGGGGTGNGGFQFFQSF